jgi:hypothetical protein
MRMISEDVNRTYDQLKSFKKQNNKPTIESNGRNQRWEDVSRFLDKNSDVIFSKSNTGEKFHYSNGSDKNHGINNYRAITGMSAPGRIKTHIFQKPDNVIAPWKMNRMMHHDSKEQLKKRMQNISSKRKQGLPTNASIEDRSSHSSKNGNVKAKVKIPKITNRDGLKSQPTSGISSNLNKNVSNQNIHLKPNVNTTGNAGFRLYQTPSFVTPNQSRHTENNFTNSETTFSNTNSQDMKNQDSSMLEKHTIIFESDMEIGDNESLAPTESHILQQKHTIEFDDSSYNDGGNKNDLIRQETERRTSSKVESEKPGEFNEQSSKNLATFRNNKMKSNTDIYYGDAEMSDYQNERDTRTADQKRGVNNISKVTVNHISMPNEAGRDGTEKSSQVYKSSQELVKRQSSKTDRENQINLRNQDITDSEKEKLNDEIYLNTNSAEENPDLVDEIIKDSYSVSKRTLEVNSQSSYTVEGESQLSRKEAVIKVDKSFQIFIPKDGSIHTDPKYTDKNCQIHSQSAPTRNVGVRQDTSDFTDGQSEYINREMAKLQNNNNRREKESESKNGIRMSKVSSQNQPQLVNNTTQVSHKSKNNTTKNVPKLMNLPGQHSRKVSKDSEPARYNKNGKRPFVYNPTQNHGVRLGNADSISQLSEEKKMNGRTSVTRGHMRRIETPDEFLPNFGIEHKSQEYHPPITPVQNSIGIQPSKNNRSTGIQLTNNDKSAEIQVSFNNPSDKSAAIQMSSNDRSAAIQATYDEASAGIQANPNERSAACQVSEFNRSAGAQVSDWDRSAGVQVSHPSQLGDIFDYNNNPPKDNHHRHVWNSRGVQYDGDYANHSMQADEQPLKDVDVQ